VSFSARDNTTRLASREISAHDVDHVEDTVDQNGTTPHP
jgi:hypothetical protein